VDPDPIREYGDALAVVTVTRQGRPGVDALRATLPAATERPVRLVVADVASRAPGPAGDGIEAVHLAEDVGRAAAVNRAVAALEPAVGWVVLADPRLRWRPGAIDALLAAAARYPRAGLLGPRLHGGGPVSGGPLPDLLAAARGRFPAFDGGGPTGWLSTPPGGRAR
jgi:N-acetylglucosaminyl-diphospho-decaprenol L-rhamnosyltransferase